MFNNELNQELTTFEHHMFEYTKLALRRLHDMAIDLTGIKAAVAKNATDVASLIALAQTAISNQNDPALQGQLDTLAQSLGGTNTAIETELASVAPTGATGTAPGSTGSTDGSTGSTGPSA